MSYNNNYCPNTGLSHALQAFAREAIKKYPSLKPQVIDLLQLAAAEIADEGSPNLECEMAWQDIEELIQEQRVKEAS